MIVENLPTDAEIAKLCSDLHQRAEGNGAPLPELLAIMREAYAGRVEWGIVDDWLEDIGFPSDIMAAETVAWIVANGWDLR